MVIDFLKNINPAWLITIGILFQLGGIALYSFGTYCAGEKSHTEVMEGFSETHRNQKAIADLVNKKYDISKDIYVRDLKAYWIEEEKNKYSIGILITFFNRNNDRAYTVNSLLYSGETVTEGNGPTTFFDDILNRKFFDTIGKVDNGYYLTAGSETMIGFKLDRSFNMFVQYKDHPPLVKFNVKWLLNFDEDGIYEIRRIAKKKDKIITIDKIITESQWESLQKPR